LNTNTSTSISVSELPSSVTESLNVAAKQLSHFCESAVSSNETNVSDNNEQEEEEEEQQQQNRVVECSDFTDEKLVTGLAQPVAQATKNTEPSVIPKAQSRTTNEVRTPVMKRHIMISYNQSCRPTCKKIYDRLVEQNYKVWMDMTDMFDNILSGMAQAVENSYIVLLCINQQYFESGYCRLEAEYAAENRIKFIPCLMEKDFRAQNWLGIIKGANMHVDFSSTENFDTSFDELIRQIDFVERQLSLRPRRTPAPGPTINPMKIATQRNSSSAPSNSTIDVNSRRFDAIIREYKDSIQKKTLHLNRLKRSELADLVVKLRQELFSETSQVISDSERSDDEDEKQKSDENYLPELLRRSLDQNEVLLRLVDRLTTLQTAPIHRQTHLDFDGIIKVILAVMLLWTLNILCQKE